jgi:hypothetical protein
VKQRKITSEELYITFEVDIFIGYFKYLSTEGEKRWPEGIQKYILQKIEGRIELTHHCEQKFNVYWHTNGIRSALLLWMHPHLSSCRTLSSISRQALPVAFPIPSFKFSNVALKRRNINFILHIDPKGESSGIDVVKAVTKQPPPPTPTRCFTAA